MSWGLFKLNILRKTNIVNLNNIDNVAKIWASEYDSAVKRGRDFVNLESVQNGNKQLMETLFKVALLKGFTTPPGVDFNLSNEFGNGVKAYWAGAPMLQFPIPIIPAPGSIQNIIVNSNIAINVGTWPMYPPIGPVKRMETMIDMFILAAIIHLFSIGGIIQTTSLYPSAPSPIPAPGVIMWTGYLVPPAIPIPNINFPSEDGSEPAVVEQSDSDIMDELDLLSSNNENLTNYNGNNGNVENDSGGNTSLDDTSLQNVLNISLPDMNVESFDVNAYIANFQQQLEDDGCCCD
jgi:hypothetical protein